MPYAQTPFRRPLTTKNETIEIAITMMPTSRPCPAAGSDTNRLITRGSINPNTPATTIPTNNPIPPASDEPLDFVPVSYTHLRAHETRHDLVCRLLLEKKKKKKKKP